MLLDVCEQFDLSEEMNEKRKYAKWKAAYIHNCLKTGDKPIPGAPGEHENTIVSVNDLDDEERAKFSLNNPGANGATGPTGFNIPPDNVPPKPEDTFSAPAPASSPVTPSVQPDPVPFPKPQPATPVTPVAPSTTLLPSSGSVSLGPDQIQKAQKYCKFATSALNYDDVKTAIENLHRALNLLQTGSEG